MHNLNRLILIYFNWDTNQNIAYYCDKMMVFKIIIYDNVKFMNFNNYLVSIIIICKMKYTTNYQKTIHGVGGGWTFFRIMLYVAHD